MKKSKLGFTFVEVMVCVGIMGLLGIGVFKLISNARRTSAVAECRGMLRLSVQFCAKYLQRDIESSRAKQDEKDKKKFVMTVEPGSETSGTVVTMDTIPLDEDDTAATDVTYFDGNDEDDKKLFEEVTYDLNAGVLRRNGSKSKSLKLGEHIKSVKFEKNAIDGIDVTYDGKVAVTITAAAKPAGEKDEIEYSEQLIVSIRTLQNKILKDEDDKKFKRRISKDDY